MTDCVQIIEHIVQGDLTIIETVLPADLQLVEVNADTTIAVVEVHLENDLSLIETQADESVRIIEVVDLGPQGPAGTISYVQGDKTFTYTANDLTRIDYADGRYKLLTYATGLLSRVDHVLSEQTVRRDFVYTSGNLTAINESVIP